MTLKRLVLAVLTILVVALVGNSLLGSLTEPQITSRLQLYQTDLLLHAAEPENAAVLNVGGTDVRQALLGETPFETALNQYQEVRDTAQRELTQLQERQDQLIARPAVPESTSVTGYNSPSVPALAAKQLETTIRQQQTLLRQLNLQIGLLQAETGEMDAAIATWSEIVETDISPPIAASDQITQTNAQVLLGLWSESPRLLPDAETQLQENLQGWFRYKALTRLYDLQQRQDALMQLQAMEQETAQQAVLKLILVGTLPLFGCVLGVVLLIILLAQRLLQGKQSILADNDGATWETPWSGEIVWQVLIVGFFFVGQVALPFLLGSLGVSFAGFGSRAKAIYSLTYYLLMAGAGLTVLFLSIRTYLPLPDGWFRLKLRSNWILWGVGGYFTALPLMILVSVLNQRIWQGQGGSNPLLQIVLEEGDSIALSIFFATAAIAAPLFEETLFRGFLLPSLTRYMSVGWAIAASSLLFAVAHLSLSEVLPLTVLGAILGFIYTRSRNLLAPMLLHSLWNSVTMISLFILGSGNS